MPGSIEGAIPPLASIHHVAITVTDVARSVAWYKRVFGFEEMGTAPHPGGYGLLLQLPGVDVVLAIHHHDTNQGEPFAETRTGLDHVGFAVPTRADVEAWRKRFDELGVKQSPITDMEDFDVSVLVFRDPDNIQLELFAPRRA
ncbi:MAG: VOC family protein [Actinomycetota bacterium]|nr:VOC family protein [Actinomycetota bacterium]